jgi:hypothetical protein
MVHVVADESWLLKDLALFAEPVEVRDEDGKLLGLFVPANLERGQQIYAEVAAGADRAEIERLRQSKEPGRTTAEVLQRLQAGVPDAGSLDALPPAPAESGGDR